MRALSAVTCVLLITGATPALAEHCPKDVLAAMDNQLSADGTAVAYRTDPAKIAVGQPFSIEVVACVDGKAAAAPSRIRVDAGMPMHGHGMNYKPSESKIGPGHSKFEGLVFHMPGAWQITFDVYEGNTRKRLTEKVKIGR